MPNAAGQITTRDVRLMREMRAAGYEMMDIARTVGVGRSTVYAHAGDVVKGSANPKPPRDMHAAMRAQAHRYAAFVERASAFVPRLVEPTPF